MGARVYLEALTTRKTKALGGAPKEITDELGDVAAVLLRRLDPPEADVAPDTVDLSSDPLLVSVA